MNERLQSALSVNENDDEPSFAFFLGFAFFWQQVSLIFSTILGQFEKLNCAFPSHLASFKKLQKFAVKVRFTNLEFLAKLSGI